MANALDDTGISFSDGRPVSRQNKELSTWDLSIEHNFWSMGDDLATAGLSARVGQLTLGQESGLRTGIGAFIGKELGWLSLSLPVGIIWLKKTEFGAEQLRTKNYGGNLQFTMGAEMGLNMPGQWQLFYRFEHMSNGNHYDYNPALNSHNIGFRLSF
ncbi:MAG: acyloxyacyl hydrolase [Plesiomonas sp.]